MMRAAVPSAIWQERLESWVADYADAILRACYLCLGDTGLAEDAMQETFLKAWKAMGNYERSRIQSDKAWLMRIALNTCHDVQRSRWMRHVDTRQALDDLPPSIVAVMPEDHTLRLLIGSLPEKYKQVVLLCFYQEMTEREAAEALDISVSTVSKRLKKAQALLRSSLTEEGTL